MTDDEDAILFEYTKLVAWALAVFKFIDEWENSCHCPDCSAVQDPPHLAIKNLAEEFLGTTDLSGMRTSALEVLMDKFDEDWENMSDDVLHLLDILDNSNE